MSPALRRGARSRVLAGLGLAWMSTLAASPRCPTGQRCVEGRLPSGEVLDVPLGFPLASTLDARPLPERAGWLDLYSFQVGAFLDDRRAESLTRELRLQGVPAFLSSHEWTRRGDRSKVLVGEYLSYREAKQAAVALYRRRSLPYSIDIWRKIEGVLPGRPASSPGAARALLLVSLDRTLRTLSELGALADAASSGSSHNRAGIDRWIVARLLDLRLGMILLRRFSDRDSASFPRPLRALASEVGAWLARAGQNPLDALRNLLRGPVLNRWTGELQGALNRTVPPEPLRILSARYEDGTLFVEGLDGARPVFLLVSTDGRVSPVLYNQGYAEELSGALHLFDLDGDGDPEVLESTEDGSVRIYARRHGVDRIVWAAGTDVGEAPCVLRALDTSDPGAPRLLLSPPLDALEAAGEARLLPFAATHPPRFRIAAPTNR